MSRRVVLAGAVLLALAAPRGAAAQAFAPAQADQVLTKDDLDLKTLDDRMTFVEREYTRKDEGAAQRAARKFSDGEIQFLLKDWVHASILLYDAIETPEFRGSSDYPTALYYLAESLYQQQNYPSARPYFRQLLALRDPRNYQDAILRTLDIAIKLQSYDGIDDVIAQARAAFGGAVPAEVLYLSAKATYNSGVDEEKRGDVTKAHELYKRALDAFAQVPQPYVSAAGYFTGVLLVRANAYTSAIEAFERCSQVPAVDARQKEIRELCFMAQARLYYETGRYSDALDRYQEIGRDSPHFNEALFEIAWTFVKAKKYEEALRAADLLLLAAPDSTLAPEAKILEGHLYLKLGKYQDALTTYNDVINHYAPVRDEISAILEMHEDPVKYFNELIGKSDTAFDVSTVLPPVAVKWASTQQEVGDALHVVADLEGGRKGIDESNQIADRIDAVLVRHGGLDAFPHLQEGIGRADAVDTGAARVEADLNQVEGALLGASLTADQRKELDDLRRSRAELEQKIKTLPATPEEVDERTDKMRQRLAELDKEAFQQGYLIEACKAAITGSEKWLDDHHDEIQSDAQGRSEMVERMRKEREVVAGLEQELRDLRKDIARAADQVGGVSSTAGEAELRAEYDKSLARERELLGQARSTVGGSEQAELARVDALRQHVRALEARSQVVRKAIQQEALSRAQELRRRVEGERRLLAQYTGEVNSVQGDAKNLVGRIAFKSFSDVREQFYKLVLKADVGIVDVAWTRKRDRLEKIQQLSAEKARDLQSLDDEFKGVLKEVE